MSHKVHCEPGGSLVYDRKDVSNWSCTGCGRILNDYADVAYDGPARKGRPDPQNTDCSPFQEWATLCRTCAQAEDEL